MIHRLSAKVKHCQDSPWREYLFLGVNGTWTWVGEGDCYGDPCEWGDVVEFLIDSYEFSNLVSLDLGEQLTIEEATKRVRR